MPNPFVPWTGGKRRIADQIIKYFPDHFSTYHEPFLGGGAIFFKLLPKRAILSDINPHLIDLYQQIKHSPRTIYAALQHRIKHHSREYYLSVRKSFNHAPNPEDFFYLCQAGYNGLIRFNRKGHFNVPPADRVLDPGLKNVIACSLALRNAELSCCSYDLALLAVKPNDLVYLDPPYDIAGGHSYAPSKFGPREQELLASHFHYLVDLGAHVFLSNYDTPLIRKLYSDHYFIEITNQQSIAPKAKHRRKVKEVLVIGRRSN